MTKHLAFAMCVLATGVVFAEEPKGMPVTAEEFEAKLGYETGTVELPGGMARIQLPPTFRFLGKEGSRRLLTQGWGNPPDAVAGVLGMLVPTAVSPLTPEGWAVVITYDEDGYVNDKDAASIDYTKMLKQMKEATAEGNKEREKQGFDTVTLIGWAEPPSYDAATHKMYWAKELQFGKGGEHTLNYDMRILGRRGVLSLNAVAPMKQLATIHGQTKDVLAAVEFSDGHRYADYLPGKDKAATYGVAGLIAGAVAAKAGLFKLLWVGILAFKKLILVAIVGIGAALKKFFGRGSKTASDAPIEP